MGNRQIATTGGNRMCFRLPIILSLLCVRGAAPVAPPSDHLWCHDDHGREETGAGEEGGTAFFETALAHIQSTNLSRDGLQRLLDGAMMRFPCQHSNFNVESSNSNRSKWMTADNVYRTLNLTGDSYIDEVSFRKASILVVAHLFSLSSNGSEASQITWNELDVDGFQKILLQAPDVEGHEASECLEGNETICLSEGQLESVLRTISTEYVSGDLRNCSGCREEERAKEKAIRDTMCTFGDMKSFSSRSLRRDVVHNETETLIAKELLGDLAATIFANLLSGDCIVESEEELSSAEDYLQSLFATFADNDTCGISHEGLEAIAALLKIGVVSTEGGAAEEEESPGHAHRRKRRATDEHEHEHEHEHEDVETECLSLEVLLRGFQLDVTHRALSRSDLYRLCPALLQQATVGCRPKATPQPEEVHSRPSSAEVYGYGTLAVGIVSACVVLALVVVRWKGTKIYRYLISTMLGLAVGSLAGDALLHLIPQALGAHDESGHHDHGADEGLVVEPYVWKALCGCGSLWFYYNLQLFLYKAGSIAGYLRRVLGRPSKSISTEGSDHGHVDLNGSSSNVILNAHVDRCDDDAMSTSSPDLNDVGESKDDGKKKMDKHRDKEEEEEDGVVHAHSSVAWMITIGDAIHNFADGLAMGGAFSTDWKTGIGMTIAIFTHELPHEFGDTAVLLSAGWSTKKVLLFQLLSQATAFVGLYIGISVSENTDGAQLWIAAVAYGMFLYIALADVIPELIHFFSIYSPWLIFVTSNFGILIGFLAMLLLAIYEEKISIG